MVSGFGPFPDRFTKRAKQALGPLSSGSKDHGTDSGKKNSSSLTSRFKKSDARESKFLKLK